MISICCVGFASIDVVCDELNGSSRGVVANAQDSERAG